MSRKKGMNNKGEPSENAQPERKVTLDFRYGANWVVISRNARKVCPKCCYCLKADVDIVHHTRYVDHIGQLLLDNLILGRDIFPLCESCHRKVHSNKNWIFDSRGKEFNHNNPKIITKLELNFGIQSMEVSL